MSGKAKRIAAVLLLAAAAGGIYAYFTYRAPEAPATYQGYVEGEAIQVASPVAGTVAKLAVRRGETVPAGSPLFALDRTSEIALRDESAAALRFAEAQYKRQQELITTKATSAEKLDAARNAFEQARATLTRAEHRLEEMAPKAPTKALVEDTMALPGDFVPAGTPIVRLLPPDRVRLRYFVPETALASTNRGDVVDFRCDGCPGGLRARIVFVSPRAEYTPPVIYSVHSRAKLVFMVEAVPIDPPLVLKPGQPVDVGAARPDGGIAQAERLP